MKMLLRIEEALQFVLAIYLTAQLPFEGWIYAVLFLAPDISMAGYIFNRRLGALSYNIFHHKGIAVAIYLAGIYTSSPVTMFIGLLLFGHSSFDRILGYGLKFQDDFKHTHLGWIGNK